MQSTADTAIYGNAIVLRFCPPPSVWTRTTALAVVEPIELHDAGGVLDRLVLEAGLALDGLGDWLVDETSFNEIFIRPRALLAIRT